MNDAVTMLDRNPCEMEFQSEWLTENLMQVSLKIEHSVTFKNRLRAQGISLPSSLDRAVLSRQCEFLAGRACVQKAMSLLGAIKTVQPLIGAYREPLWPDGYHGSITHSATLAVSLVTTHQYYFIGIDRQEWLPDTLAHSLAPDILGDNEYKWFTHFPDYREFVTTVFSAKESLFKAMFPSIQRYVDFSVAELIAVDTQQGILRLELTQTLSPDFYKGKCVEVDFRRYVDDVETRIIDRKEPNQRNERTN
ncbi:4'-phosphopantetheinyl transferase family protein [Vibrio coralliilyticus]|nr:4'-phosphopantetheinyl transferase superfamily protein [Vibrio coralliilyticus]